VGYFQAEHAAPEEIVAANLAALARLDGEVLSVKAPPLGFDPGYLRAIAEAAAAKGIRLMFDSHAARHADATHAAADALLADFPDTGIAMPARWRRSGADAACWRDRPARIRLVKGEWADPISDVADVQAAYLRLAQALAGREAPVAVATHDPKLAEQVLSILVAARTPCELEQLRGLPRRRTIAVARRLGVPVRIYVPFGPGWWPYALDQALDRPWLPAWFVRDRFAGRGARRPERVPQPAE
jgi:proline dehydrogenase